MSQLPELYPAEYGLRKAVEGPDTIPVPELDRVLKLWQTRATAGLPHRTSFSTTELAPVAKSMAIIDRIDTPEGAGYRCRFIGTDLVAIYGEISGRVLATLRKPPWYDRFTGTLDRIVEVRCPIYSHVGSMSIPGMQHLQNHVLYLPLSDDGAVVSSVFMIAKMSFRRLD